MRGHVADRGAERYNPPGGTNRVIGVAMTYKGTVADGVVVPQRGVQLPEGADVRIQVLKAPKTPESQDHAPRRSRQEPPPLTPRGTLTTTSTGIGSDERAVCRHLILRLIS